jgi:hypothetical protein
VCDSAEPAIEQSLAADGTIACFSSNLISCWLDADRAPQLKASVMQLTQMLGKTTEEAIAVELRRMLKVCPACQASLANHSYALFAITIASDERKKHLLEFVRALQFHDWRVAQQFSDFDPLLNATEAFALKCLSGSLVLLVVRNPFELFESSNILQLEVLGRVSGEELESLIESDKWRTL